MQLKFTMQETEQLILRAIREEWPGMIRDDQQISVSINSCDGVKIELTDKENEGE